MTDTPRFLPYGRQTIDADDIEAVVRVLKSGWLTTGPLVAAFEEQLASRAGARYAVACSSGTAALHLAALALEWGAGDEVIVPTMTFLATANAARYVGAEVVFADVNPETGLLEAAGIEQALARARRPKAVIPVHLNGQSVDMEAVADVAHRHGLAIIEDGAHALGSVSRLRTGEMTTIGACKLSNMNIFSFHPVKTITMGEGGAVATNDERLYRRLLRMRNHGMVREASDFESRECAFDADGQLNPWYYEMPEPGFNYRACDIQCALGLSQLGKLDRFVERRRALVESYDVLIAPFAPVIAPVKRVPTCEAAWHLYPVLIDFDNLGMSRAQLMRLLQERGIGTQVHYFPVHMQPYYRRRYGELRLSGAEAYYHRVLSLPLFPGMLDTDPERVVAEMARALGLTN
jgi:UDP-4-amino-4,6-dideoxy-N-acetyl-beta-L-altrosamine transaminase